MASQELYIRNASDTEARGPYGVEQLASLADAGQVSGETLVYDAEAEQWVALSTKAELMAVIFPEKKKLGLKKTEFKSLNKTDEKAKAITVDDMLAAAEGRTDDTSDKANPEIAMLRAARIGMWAALVALVISAAGEILPSTEALTSGELGKLVSAPVVLLGCADVFLAVMLGLGVVSLYPFIRFRAALGLGWLGITFWLQNQQMPLLALAIGSAGLYLCTVFVRFVPVVVAAAAGVLGMAAVTWQFLSH
jgi:uncharacterized protein DUF4339